MFISGKENISDFFKENKSPSLSFIHTRSLKHVLSDEDMKILAKFLEFIFEG